MVVVGSTLFLLAGSSVVTLVPKATFAALLVGLGSNLLFDNLRTAYSDLQTREFVLVVLHIGITGTLGMLYAVVLGMAFTALIFIVQYASHSGVLQCATSLLERSKVGRTVAEQDILEQYGASVLIIHLHGMIFFGSANSVVDEVRSHLATLAELQLPLRFLLLDFRPLLGDRLVRGERALPDAPPHQGREAHLRLRRHRSPRHAHARPRARV